MKKYLTTIKYTQEILLVISVATLLILPLLMVFSPETISSSASQTLFSISHWFLLFVMIVRPLADIFMNTKWIRPLVILRKGTGVLSASIIVSFILAKLMIDPYAYLATIGTVNYWSMVNYALFAHIADISAVILLITSNNFSKRILGDWWKKIQKLSYVYFYGSTLYVFLSYNNTETLIAILLVTIITYIAFIKNRTRLEQNTLQKTLKTIQ